MPGKEPNNSSSVAAIRERTGVRELTQLEWVTFLADWSPHSR
ncbi:MAG TPA: hypothetical protein VG165_10365 [Solirubrobacteraceae bacterium]|nr:hypothetical protein [Solirubrobacteraceae bacterium]